MWNKKFWIDATERALKTTAQAAIGVLTSGAIGILETNWQDVTSIAALAGLVSVLTSVASSGAGNRGSASLVD